MEHGTLEDRGEACARGCKSGREGGGGVSVGEADVWFSPTLWRGTFEVGSCTSLLRERDGWRLDGRRARTDGVGG